MAGTNWGSSAGVLRTLLSLVKSVVDYLAPILPLASPRALESLYIRHRRAVRYIAGLTSRTSDIVAGIMCSIEPLELTLFRAMGLSYERMRRLPQGNPMRDMVDQWRAKGHFLQRLKRFTWVEMAEYLLDQLMEPLPFRRRSINYLSPYPPHVPPTLPAVCCSLPGSSKKKSDKVIRSLFSKLIHNLEVGTLTIYTDGATPKESTLSGYGFHVQLTGSAFTEDHYGPVHGGIFTAEQTAIYRALDLADGIVRTFPVSRIIIFSDSLSTLRALANPDHDVRYDLISDIRFQAAGFCRKSVPVVFHWIPSHRGIRGNEAADRLADIGQRGHIVGRPYPDVGYDTAALIIHQHLRTAWQREWRDMPTHRTLFKHQPRTRTPKDPWWQLSRHQQSVVSKARAGSLLFYSQLSPDGKCTTPCRLCRTADRTSTCVSLPICPSPKIGRDEGICSI